MKKWGILFLATAMVASLFLTGCKNPFQKDDDPAKTSGFYVNNQLSNDVTAIWLMPYSTTVPTSSSQLTGNQLSSGKTLLSGKDLMCDESEGSYMAAIGYYDKKAAKSCWYMLNGSDGTTPYKFKLTAGNDIFIILKDTNWGFLENNRAVVMNNSIEIKEF